MNEIPGVSIEYLVSIFFSFLLVSNQVFLLVFSPVLNFCFLCISLIFSPLSYWFFPVFYWCPPLYFIGTFPRMFLILSPVFCAVLSSILLIFSGFYSDFAGILLVFSPVFYWCLPRYFMGQFPVLYWYSLRYFIEVQPIRILCVPINPQNQSCSYSKKQTNRLPWIIFYHARKNGKFHFVDFYGPLILIAPGSTRAYEPRAGGGRGFMPLIIKSQEHVNYAWNVVGYWNQISPIHGPESWILAILK